jgi:hypothetical protein
LVASVVPAASTGSFIPKMVIGRSAARRSLRLYNGANNARSGVIVTLFSAEAELACQENPSRRP